MSDLENLLSSASSLSIEIGKLLKTSKYREYDDLSGLKIDFDDAEQLLLLDELRGILEKLEDAKNDIDYLNRPVGKTSTLQKNSTGRYETEHKEYTSGNDIEVLIYDKYRDKEVWVKTSVEHNGNDYYLVAYKKAPMQGLKVRTRK
jgi:hypothetical protein